MEKEFTINTIEGIYTHLIPKWNENLGAIKLKSRALYNLIGLKKTIEERHAQTQEAVVAIMKRFGAEQIENGGLKVPEDKIADTNAELMKLSEEKIKIEFSEIKVGEDDELPPELMEILFDFIIFN